MVDVCEKVDKVGLVVGSERKERSWDQHREDGCLAWVVLQTAVGVEMPSQLVMD